MGLTTKQRKFINEYLKNFNATQAAINAGYSERSARSIGSENLTKPDIWAEIQKSLRESAMSAEEVLMRLAEQARVDLGRFLEVEEEEEEVEDGEEGETVIRQILRINYKKVKDSGHLVKSLTFTNHGPKIELYDAQSALRLIGKAHGIFSDKLDITSDGKQIKFIFGGADIEDDV